MMCPQCKGQMFRLDWYGLAVCRACKEYFTNGEYEGELCNEDTTNTCAK